MHTAQISGWAGSMLLYEILIVDRTDTVFNPIWRQGCYAMPMATRLGAVSSAYGWSQGLSQSTSSSWTYEAVIISHILLSGLLVLASQWHWAYSDLDLFISSSSGNLVLDLNRIFGIHLCLSSLLCFAYGIAHLSGASGPGIWTSDAYGILGSARGVKPSYALTGLVFSSYGVVTANHIVAGAFGFIVSIWHISVRPQPSLYSILAMGNLEVVLASSIAAVFFIGYIVAASMWYASVTTPIELLGPSRYQWDNAYFALDIGSRLNTTNNIVVGSTWDQIPDKLVLYDYIGCNPAKGGIFRSGPMDKGDGVVQNWIGHPYFELGTLALTVRRMPAFFETFPVLMIDQGGTLRSDIPFRRAESLYSIEQCKVTVFFAGGALDGSGTSTSTVVKAYARKSQFGETFTFDKKGVSGDGVFRTSARGWYTFTHIVLASIFFFGHLWHASRSLFRDLWTGVTVESMYETEYGRNEKLGDATSKSSRAL
jgi:photosystem II CP47 chlorophyll apoprotein